MTDNNNLRQVPTNDLDLQMSLTNPAWQDLSPDLRQMFIKEAGEYFDENGIKQQAYKEISGLLGVYTRDLRLGNLKSDEAVYVSYHIALCVDLLASGMVEASILSLNKALSVLEPSSSRGGFLRTLLNTFRTESISNTTDAKKVNLMGKNQNMQGAQR